jgi:outer membrane protein TolC
VQPISRTRCPAALAAAMTSTLALAPAVALAVEPTSAQPGREPAVLSPDLAQIEARVLAHHPSRGASAHRERALLEESRAEGSLPPPEAMVELWQVPLSRPYALGDAGMLMLSLRQEIPAPGSLGAASRASEAEAHAETVARAALERQLVREADRAFADYVEATSRSAVRQSFVSLADDVVAASRHRYAAGGSLSDVTRAELERARLDAELRMDAGAVQGAAARLNVLIGRRPEDQLGAPRVGPAETVGAPLDALVSRAMSGNAEASMADAAHAADVQRASAADTRSKVPSFLVGLDYFHPVNGMPAAWGATASMSLPWLWGEAGHRAESAREMAAASTSTAAAVRVRVRSEVASAWIMAKTAERRFVSLRDGVVPAARRTLDASRAAYSSPSGPDLLSLLDAARAAFDVELDAVAARGELDRALAELDASVGARVPRVPIPTTERVAAGEKP